MRGERLQGALAAAVALAFLWAASRVEPALAFPPFSLAERTIRATPGDIATFFIERLEHAAMPALAVGVALAFVVIGALLPSAARVAGSRRGACAAVLFGLGVAGAALAEPGRSALLPLAGAAVAAAALYGATFAWLDGAARLYASGHTDAPRRRAFAAAGGAAAGLFLGGTVLGRFVDRLSGPNRNIAIASPNRPVPDVARPPFPAIEGLSREVTSVADHYVVDIDLMDPVVEAAGWTVTVDGRVEEPLELTFDELQGRYEVVEQHSVLTCISNEVGGPLVGSSTWTGVRLRDVLSEARHRSDAADVVFHCADGYTASIPIRRALEPTVLLAFGHGGQPLTQEHGFPCRVRAPALYGVKNVKWLERIEVVDFDQRSYWTERGWTDEAVVRTQSRIDTPREVRAGLPTWIAGVAWAGERRVKAVEVSVDGGRTWTQAKLRPPLSSIAWTQWALRWTPRARGVHRLEVRAIDGRGERQEARRRRPHPSGAAGYHQVDVEVT